MELFKGQSLLEFTERFKTDLDCEEYLASLKWGDGYCSRKCGQKRFLMDLIQKVLLQEHYFMQKVRETMKSSESHKMNDSV